MATYRSRTRRAPDPVLTVATAGAILATAWALDAWRRTRASAELHRTLIDLLLNALHSGDAETERHSRRVADLTDALAAAYGLGRRARARLRVAALLHDVGKMDDTLFKIVHSCDTLSAEDRREIERHPTEGADIIRPLDELHPGISSIVESHHECWNGEGYPDGLMGSEIPLEARILSAADVFDAMTQPRNYHEPYGVDEALERIRRSSGARFDPEVVRRVNLPEVKERWAMVAAMGRLQESRVEEGSAVGASG
jgi:putative nucleotidyltransferase with HDIG domain